MNIKNVAKRALCYTLSFMIALQPNLALSQEAALVVDTSAPASNQATVDTTFNDIPLLQIVAPNASGLSHNKFTDFNVGSSGLVINNATADSISKLGGAITKNPNFSGTAASLILNEVTSANRSSLKGFTEIAGQKADYILANPNGITCNGCGFINTPRATLTTGMPVFDGALLKSLSVTGGDVLIEGLGLNANEADAFDIVTRSAKIVAQINAQNLYVTTGRNDVDYTTRNATAKTDDGSTKPTLAIDSSALGGMYAGRIALVATETGVGVNMQSDMAASASDLTITADGRIEVNKAQANGNVTVASASNQVDLYADVSSGGNADIQAATTVSAQNVTVSAEGDLSLKGPNIDVSNSQIVAGIDGDGALQAAQGTLTATATNSFTYTGGKVGAGKDLTIKAGAVDSGASSNGLVSKGTLNVEASQMSKISGGVSSGGDMTLNVASLGLAGGAVSSGGDLTITTDALTNTVSVQSTGDTTIESAGAVLNDTGATIKAGGALSMIAKNGNVTNRSKLESGAALSVTSSGYIRNESAGRITSNTDITLKAQGGELYNAGEIEALGGVDTTASTNVTNDMDAKIAAGKTLTLGASEILTNGGIVSSSTAQTLSAANLTNNGILKSGSSLTATVTNNFTNTQTVNTSGDLTLYVSNQLLNQKPNDDNDATIKAAGNIIIQKNAVGDNTAKVENVSATIEADGNLSVKADQLINRKKTFTTATRTDSAPSESGGSTTVTYDVQYVSADSDAARMLAGNDISLSGGDVTNSQSLLHANGNMDIQVTNFTNETSELTTTRNARTRHVKTWKKCKWWGGCKHYSQTWYTTDSQLQADKTQTVFGTTSATDTLSGNVSGLLSLTGVSEGGARVGLAAGSIDTSVNGASALPSADNVDTTFSLPKGNYGEFITTNNPNAKYLIEQNPELADLGKFYGSDYFITKSGIDPNKIAKRLGDGAFETDIIQKEIFKRTGQRFLADSITSSGEQMQSLMDAAVQTKTDLNLSFGIDLGAAQVAALTSDIIWMVEREVQGETVLVPKLYLAQLTRDNISTRGGAIIAGNINLSAGDVQVENGRIAAKNGVTLVASNSIVNRGGEIVSDGDITLTAGKDIAVQSGVVSGDNVDIDAAGNITVETVNTRIQNGVNDDNLLNQQAAIFAKTDLDITSGNDLSVKGAKLTAANVANLTSGGDTNISTAQYTDSYSAELGNGYDRRRETKNLGSTVTAGGDVNVASDGDMALNGSTLEATNDVNVDVKGDLTVATAQDALSAESLSKTSTGGFFGGSVSTETRQSSTTQVASLIKAGGNVEVNVDVVGANPTYKASSSVTIDGSRLTATGDVVVHADGDVTLMAARDSRSDFNDTQKNGTFSGSKSKIETASTTLARAEIDSGGDAVLHSGNGNVALKAASLDAEGNVSIEAENGAVAVLTDTETDYRSEETEKKGLFIKAVQQGNADETAKHTEINVGGDLVIKSGAGVVVEYRGDGGLDGAVASLSKQPGLEWMTQVKARDDAVWKAVNEAHQSWHEEQETLNPAAGAVIAIAITVATYGAAGELALGVMGAEGMAGMTTTQLAMHGALQAGFSSLASQAGVAMVANKGDIGAVFKELASSSTLRSLATTMVTAGVLQGAGDIAGIDLAAKDLPGRIQAAALRTTVNTAVQSTIGGQELGDALKTSLITAGTQVIGGELAEQIGEASKAGQINDLTRYLAHAAVGCASGAATSGDCASGAGGAVVGEAAADIYKASVVDNWLAEKFAEGQANNLTPEQVAAQIQPELAELRAKGVDIARLTAAMGVALAGGDPNVAADAGENAAEENALFLTIAAVIIAGNAIYAAIEGDGNVIAGVDKILAGEDTVSKLAQQAAQKGVELGYAVAPEATQATLNGLAEAGELAGTAIYYVDDKTGDLVSSTWNDLDADTRENVKRAGFFLEPLAGGVLAGTAKGAKELIKLGSKFKKPPIKLTIRDHYEHHKDMVTDLTKQLLDKGYIVSKKEVSFGDSCGNGRCRPDIVYKTSDGKFGIIEVKTGNGDLSIRQSQIFPQIKDGDAIPRGDVAAKFRLTPGVPLRDQGYPNGIPIEVHRFPGASS